MLKTAAVAVLALPVMLVGLALSSSCVVVDVKQADGPRIVVPVPLFLARTALAFAPDEARRVEIPELGEYHDVASRIIDELVDAPDGILVEVRDGDDDVLIEKVGDEIEIHVESDEETVAVRVPLTMVADVLDGFDGTHLETRDVLHALASANGSDLVHVKSAEEEVHVWIW